MSTSLRLIPSWLSVLAGVLGLIGFFAAYWQHVRCRSRCLTAANVAQGDEGSRQVFRAGVGSASTTADVTFQVAKG